MEEPKKEAELLDVAKDPIEAKPAVALAQAAPAKKVVTSEPKEVFFGGVLIFCLALSLIAATGYFGLAGYRYFKQVQAEKAIPSIEALPKVEVVETAPETNPESSASAESEPVAAPEKLSAIDKGKLSVKVLNGGSAKGVAGTYAEKLKQAGFTKTAVGNAFGDYAGQTLYFAKGQEAGLDVLKTEIMKTYSALVVKETPAGDKDAAAATYVLILGR